MRKKIIIKIGQVIATIILLFLLITLFLRVLGYKTYIVSSSSMHPTIPKLSLIYVKEDTYEKNDIIAFNYKNTRIVHRIVSIDENTIITHGDNNSESTNEIINKSDVIGVVQFHLPIIGIFFIPYVYISITCLLVIVVVIKRINEIIRSRKDESKKETNS